MNAFSYLMTWPSACLLNSVFGWSSSPWQPFDVLELLPQMVSHMLWTRHRSSTGTCEEWCLVGWTSSPGHGQLIQCEGVVLQVHAMLRAQRGGPWRSCCCRNRVGHQKQELSTENGKYLRQRWQFVWNTWRRSSKSRAASFFMPEALCTNFRIVSRPNVGTSRYLCKWLSRFNLQDRNKRPFIKRLNAVTALSVQNSEKMGECCFPYTEFKLMQEIDNK